MKRTKIQSRKGFKKLTLEQVKEKQLKRNPKLISYGLGTWGKKPSVRAKTAPKRVKKPKLASISKLKKTLWKLVSDYIRERDNFVCFTSGVKVSGSNAHCGHMYPSSVGGVLLRYHPYNLACQSYVENIHHSGNGAIFYQKALEKYGTEEMDKLKHLKNCSAQGDRQFYSTLIELYKEGNEVEIVKYLNGFA